MRKRTVAILVIGTLVLVSALLAAGSVFVVSAQGQQGIGRPNGGGGVGWNGMMGRGGPGMMGRGGSGMMGGSWGNPDVSCPYAWGDSGIVASAPIESLEAAGDAVRAYVDSIGLKDVRVTEVMQFSNHYYAIVAEEATGIGAMELLVDPKTGRVAPEPGPNMMWNARYGMHRGGMMGMMGWRGDGYDDGTAMTIVPDKARIIAEQWLDKNLPGRQVGAADAFYGYYTLHFSRDGRIEGMLSVHGESGRVWYHSWHGEFVQMTEHSD
jgi:hypothetical protein